MLNFLVNFLSQPENTSMKRPGVVVPGPTATATVDLPLVSKYVSAVEALNLWCDRSQEREKNFLPGHRNRKLYF